MFTLIVIALAAIAVLGNVWNAVKKDELDEQKEFLDKLEVSLNEWANKLAMWEEQLSEKNAGYKVIDAVYTVTESDLMKYSSDRAIKKNACDRLSRTIAEDILRNFPPHEWYDEERGVRRFGSVLIVKERK